MKRVRSRERYEGYLRRSRRRDSPDNGGIAHFYYYQGDINVEQPPWITKTTQMYRSYVRTRQTPGGSDGSSPGDEGDSSPRRRNSGRDQPSDHQRSKTPQRRTTRESPDGDPRSDASPGDGRHPQEEIHPEEEDHQDHQEEDHLVHLKTLDPQEIKDPQVPLDHEAIEYPHDHKDLWDHKVHQDK